MTSHSCRFSDGSTPDSTGGRKGLRGQKAVNAVFGVVYTGDLILNTALGLYKPTQWSLQDWLVDVIDKYVQAQATGAIFDRIRQD